MTAPDRPDLAAPGPQQPDDGLTGQAVCTVCRTRCGLCGCRMGGCYTEAWWATQGSPSLPAAPSAQPDETVTVAGPEAHGPWCNGYLIGSCDCAIRTPAQPDERRCTCDTWNRWSNNHSAGCPVLLTNAPAQPDECAVRGHTPDRLCRRCATPAQPVRDTEEGRRAPVQGTPPHRPPGTVDWEEHERAAADYMRRFPNGQDAEVLARRGGFDYGELTDHLGHEPRTWQPR